MSKEGYKNVIPQNDKFSFQRFKKNITLTKITYVFPGMCSSQSVLWTFCTIKTQTTKLKKGELENVLSHWGKRYKLWSFPGSPLPNSLLRLLTQQSRSYGNKGSRMGEGSTQDTPPVNHVNCVCYNKECVFLWVAGKMLLKGCTRYRIFTRLPCAQVPTNTHSNTCWHEPPKRRGLGMQASGTLVQHTWALGFISRTETRC